MNRTSVQSSNLKSVGYDLETNVLEIEFHNGGLYRYTGVPERIYRGLMNAGSHGSYFHQHIKDKYNTTKIR
jgi:hypothetical protein